MATGKIQKMKMPMLCIFLLLLAIPACGNELPVEIEISKSPGLVSYDETDKTFLSNRIGILSKFPGTNNGFVLCELMNLRGAKLNVCYLKKDLKTMPILNLNRLFLEVKLDF
jgi:hypothetical protein